MVSQKSFFNTLLELSVTNSFFIFNGTLFRQIEGLEIGLLVGPVFANIFMSFMDFWLDECPPDFKPMYYRRHVDDSILLFKSEDQVTHFQNYLDNNIRILNLLVNVKIFVIYLF